MNFDYVTKENIQVYNQNWQKISDQFYEILINGVSGPGKTNALPNLIS